MRVAKTTSRRFEGMNAEEIAAQIEEDIKAEARQWSRNHPQRTQAAIETASIATAALYLQANHSLYFRDDSHDMKAAHHKWMELMKQWFVSVVAPKGRPYTRAN